MSSCQVRQCVGCHPFFYRTHGTLHHPDWVSCTCCNWGHGLSGCTHSGTDVLSCRAAEALSPRVRVADSLKLLLNADEEELATVLRQHREAVRTPVPRMAREHKTSRQ